MKHYWEVLKAFEEGKTLAVDGGYAWSINKDIAEEFATELFEYESEDWQIVKSDYEKALDIIIDEHDSDSDFNFSRHELEKLAKLMVNFKNGR